MKQPVIIPDEFNGIEKLSYPEQTHIYNWYYEQKDKLDKDPLSKQHTQLACQREKIRLDCIAKHGEYTEAGKQEFERRCKAEIPQWPEVDKTYKSRNAFINQQFNRRVLSISWDRGTQTDVIGKPLLKPEEWLEQFGYASTLQRHRMEQPYVKAVQSSRLETFNADRLIADNLKDILDAGFVSAESCSGMLADHPDRRYYVDSSDGGKTYKAGQPVNQTLYGSNAYISFFKPESRWKPSLKNTAEQIEQIRDLAQKNGWVALDTVSMLQPALRLELPMTYDGSSMDEIIKEAEQLGLETIEGFAAMSYPKKASAMLTLNKEVAKHHGGIVPWTDALMQHRWNALSTALKHAVKIGHEQNRNPDLDRITNARLISKTDGSPAVRCCIDGVQQSIRDIPWATRIDIKESQCEWTPKEICALVYKEELSASQDNQNQRSNGLKR